ncbi:hypothetical protein [Legionella impletisoli]|uniref:Uncharacterized protein n=1 Tax=Legionella impletisoli TaxID=343510 RepID=A0A917NEG1_9GAMM|nr:hypothetical protein [Legionella impletisoli]GGI92775.1 hypothetical protein GCM10007966_21690 [Legionella impletisoli]
MAKIDREEKKTSTKTKVLTVVIAIVILLLVYLLFFTGERASDEIIRDANAPAVKAHVELPKVEKALPLKQEIKKDTER